MTRLNVLMGAIALSATMTGGCGAVANLFPDGGSTDQAMLKLFLLEPGDYKVTSLTNKTDGCQIDTDPMHPIMGATFAVTNDNMGNVGLKGFGKGSISANKGTLTSTGTQTVDATCAYMYDTKTHITLTADDTFSADYTETDSGRQAGCVPMVGATCTSSWTMVLQKM